MRTPRLHHCVPWALLALALALVGCGGGGGPPPLVAPTLVAPAPASVHTGAPAAFAWTSAGDDVDYVLVLVQMSGYETPAAALATNPVHFTTTTAALSYATTPGAPTLLAGRAYAWRVVATRGGDSLPSEASWFRLPPPGETVSREDAISILLHRVIVPATRARGVRAWLGRSPMPTGTEVWPWDEPGAKTVVSAPSWFAWVDDDPQAFFGHDTRFVLVDAATGGVTVVASAWWPVVGGTSLWMDDAAWRDREQIVYSEVNEAGEGE